MRLDYERALTEVSQLRFAAAAVAQQVSNYMPWLFNTSLRRRVAVSISFRALN
jgi:hypothetical protein